MTLSRARIAAALLGGALLSIGGAARGATFTVSSDADDGLGSLRAAIVLANEAPGPDTIDFSIAADSTIQLVTPLPDITELVTIDGGNLNVTVIGDGTSLVTLTPEAMTVEIMDVNLTGGEIAVGDQVVLAFDQMLMMGSFDNVISGAGALEKLGPEELNLDETNGVNSYSGGTTVSVGTLRGNHLSLRGDITIGMDGTLLFDQPIQGTYAGTLTGDGAFEKTGVGRLILTGTNADFMGATTVTVGVLQGDASSVVGDVTIADAAELDFAETGSGTYAGALSGGANATVRKTADGQLTLSGDNSGFAGTLIFEDGTLSGTTNSLPALIENAGNAQTDAVVINQNFDGPYTGAIEGPGGTSSGSVSKAGSGNVTLEGSIRAEIFTITQGAFTLTDNSIFDGEFRVGSGTTLQGQSDDASRITGFAQVDGTVAPGGAGAVGALLTQFDAALQPAASTFRSTSSFQVDAVESGGVTSLDLLTATSITIDPGARLELTLIGDANTFGALEPILTTTNGISGSFAFDQSFCFLDADLTQNVNEILLEITPFGQGNSCLLDPPRTPNQQAVAEVLDAAEQNLELGSFFAAIMGIEASQVPALLDAMSGEVYTSFTSARLAAKGRLDRVIETQVRGFASQAPGFVPERTGATVSGGPRLRFGAGAPLAGVAAGPDGARFAFAPAAGERGLGGWIDGYGVFGSINGSQGAADVDYGVYGTTLGLDYRLNEHFMLGAAAGYARLEPELSGRKEDAHADVGQGALFAAGAWKRLHVAGWGRYAFGGYEVDRRIAFDQLNVTANGEFDGWEFSGHGEVGVHAVDVGGFEIRPIGSIDYAWLRQDGFTETGAVVDGDSLNLIVPSETWTSLVSGVGARAQRVWELDEDTWFVPQIHARWVHEFGDTERRITPILSGTGAPYAPFIRGAEIGRDGVVAGIGWGVSSSNGLHVYADYEFAWAQNLIQNSIKAGFQFVF